MIVYINTNTNINTNSYTNTNTKTGSWRVETRLNIFLATKQPNKLFSNV